MTATEAATTAAGITEQRRLKREARTQTAYLQGLSDAVTTFLAALDAEMAQPSSVEQGQRLALLANQLDPANDRVRYFALGVNVRTDDKEAVRRAALERAGGSVRLEHRPCP